MNSFSIKSFLNLIKRRKLERWTELACLCDNMKLEALGEGSSRLVYALNKKCALKIAMNKKGLVQNEAEARIANHPLASGRVVRVLRVDPGFNWLIVERAEKISDHAWSTNRTTTSETCFNFGYGKDFGLREVEVGMLNGRKIVIDYGGTHKILDDYYG